MVSKLVFGQGAAQVAELIEWTESGDGGALERKPHNHISNLTSLFEL
jgi:hypothetical protein